MSSFRSACALALGFTLPHLDATAKVGVTPVSSTAGVSEIGALGSPALRNQNTSTFNGFVENKGQWTDEVLFFGRFGGMDATFTRDAMVFQRTGRLGHVQEDAPLVLYLPESGEMSVQGVSPGPTKHHYILAAGRGQNALGYEQILYRDLVPGIDVRVRFGEGGFAYDVLAAPGAKLEDFFIRTEEGQSLESFTSGRLDLRAGGTVVEQHIGASWQVDLESGVRQALDCSFSQVSSDPITGQIRFGFAAPDWDRTQSLVIDPTLIYGTYVGGEVPEFFETIEVNDAGSVYISCYAPDGVPTTPGAFQPGAKSVADIWIGKLSPDGSILEWATYLGGTETDKVTDIAIDSDGTVVVAGASWSSDYPTTAGSLQPIADPSDKAEVALSRLSADGSTLVWSTLYGGNGHDKTQAMSLFPNGDILLGLYTKSTDINATPGAYDTALDPNDKQLIKVSADGSTLDFATFIHVSKIVAVEVGPKGNLFMAGGFLSTHGTMPTTPGAFMQGISPIGGLNGFVMKFKPDSSDLIWSTFVGGDGSSDNLNDMRVDNAGVVYIAGNSNAGGYPITPGALNHNSPSIPVGFVTKILSNGSGLIWSASVSPPTGHAIFDELAVDAAGSVYVAGSVNQPGWPTTPDALQPNFIGPSPTGDVIFAKFGMFGETLEYSSHFAGSGTDYFASIGLDGKGTPYIGAYTSSSDIPTTPGSYNHRKPTTTSHDIVVAAFDLPLQPWRVLGSGLEGAHAPNLAGTGQPTFNAPMRLSIRGGTPNTFTWLVVGLSEWKLPFLAGIVHPSPDFYFAFPLDATGALDLNFNWPGFTSDVWFQAWTPDAGAPQGWNASNALRAVVQ